MGAVLQVAGAVALVIGIGLLSVPAAVIVGGIVVLMFGVAMERDDA